MPKLGDVQRVITQDEIDNMLKVLCESDITENENNEQVPSHLVTAGTKLLKILRNSYLHDRYQDYYLRHLIIINHIDELYTKYKKALGEDRKCFEDETFTKELGDLFIFLIMQYVFDEDFQNTVWKRFKKIIDICKSYLVSDVQEKSNKRENSKINNKRGYFNSCVPISEKEIVDHFPVPDFMKKSTDKKEKEDLEDECN